VKVPVPDLSVSAALAGTVTTVAVLLALMGSGQFPPTVKSVIVIVVVPAAAKTEVMKVPLPGLPAAKFIVAVLPVAALGALKL
jgi:hypothetical protein